MAGRVGEAERRVTPVGQDPRSRRRSEDERFVTGRGRFVADLVPAEALHLAVLRSPYAHARLRVDAAPAAGCPGVLAVATAAELAAEGVGALPCSSRLDDEAGLIVPARGALAADRVRHVGEAVACVVARTREQAIEALDAIAVAYDPLPAVADPLAALAEDAPRIWPEAPGNRAFRFRRGDPAATAAALAAARHVVEIELVNNRVAAAALEPRGALAAYRPDTGQFRLELSGASVHLIRSELAAVFGVPEEAIVVVCPDVGGGFGMKNVNYPEYVLALWAARRLGRSVAWIAERSEDFLAGVHGRDNRTRARLGLDADGRFLALAVETVAACGAALSSLGPGPATTAAAPAMGGPYVIPAISFDSTGVFTNTAPVDAYRGAGKPEANYVIERLADLAARRLGLEPAEIRRRNLVANTPYRSAMGALIDSGDARALLESALAAADAAGFPERRRGSRRRGLLRGMGIGCFLETSRGQPGEMATLALQPDGTLLLTVGTQSNGQGHETSFVQLAADRLGLPHGQFRYRQADTGALATGGGHGGARSLHMGGTALLMAADDLLAAAQAAAARLLQARRDAVVYAGGRFLVRPAADEDARALDWTDLAAALAASGDAVAGHGRHGCDLYTFPMGCHVAEVEVDPETGQAQVVRYAGVDDYGALVNPLLAEGQVQGGVAQGLGQALMEESVYDADGQLVAATFMDYALPRACDVPALALAFVETPTAANPIGAKGAGQAGAMAAPQAVVNAIIDALAPLGVEHVDMPATPQAVWRAIRAAAAAPPATAQETPEAQTAAAAPARGSGVTASARRAGGSAAGPPPGAPGDRRPPPPAPPAGR
ncbi:MAG: xanthine dehydrogenase family protein molybdopterin-binding subunit [Alsobacter sp.]